VTLTTHVLLGVVGHRWLGFDTSTCTQNLTILASAVPEISLGTSKFKVGHVTLT